VHNLYYTLDAMKCDRAAEGVALDQRVQQY